MTFAFTNGTRLAPGAFFVLARNVTAFAEKQPGVPVHGVYSGRLDNGGEKLTLSHLLGTNAWSFAYNNTVPWAITPDGYGFSLVELLSTCPTNWDIPPVQSLKWIETQMVPVYPLGDFKNVKSNQ